EPIKPKFYDITPQDSKSGCKTIWYMRDGEEATGVPLSGTDSQLVQHIVQLEYEGSGNENNTISGKNSKPPLAGFPAIRLVFVQPFDKLTKNQTYPVTGTKIIRCIGFTDNDDVVKFGNAEKIKESDVKKWAIAIAKIFNNYRWSKGRGCLSYSGLSARLQGLEGYAYCKTRADGIKLFTAMLQIFAKQPDETCFFWSENNNPEKKYSSTKKETVVLGEKYKSESLRPVADVVFDSASLVLPSKTIPLVKRNVVVYK
ncbi:MAG: hypothetical protein JGK17_32155, partial [Microcoleus sp. PH2017_10_PVI_O_A]|uniref:hypothetical protein n=1 Tax=unclassified Microcoleus TaxID=2642155 RepID=UPI001E00B693